MEGEEKGGGEVPLSTERMPVMAPLRQDQTDMTLKIWICRRGGLCGAGLG